MQELDINSISKGKSKNIKIGELSKEVIDLLGLKLNPQNINVWSTRIQEHCDKHKYDYMTPDNYYKAIKSIPLIIEEPDYVGLHSNGNIQYIKRLNEVSLVGVKIVNNGEGLLFRTIYPITEDKLKHNVRIGKFIPLK